MLAWFLDEAWKSELAQIKPRRKELKALIASAEKSAPLPALHPQMVDVLRQNATLLAARQALRGFIERIEVPPDDGKLRVIGNFGEMLTAASGWNGSTLAAVGNVGCGGPQQIVPAALLGGSVNVKTLAFPTEVPDVRRSVG